jgi:hypothetical protein
MYEPEENPRSLSRFLVPLGAIVVAAAIIAAAVFGLGLVGGDDDGGSDAQADASPTVVPSPTQPGANPSELAIGEYVRQTLAATYGGDCSVAVVTQQQPGGIPTVVQGTGASPAPTTPPPADVLCSQSRGDRENIHAYVLGKPLQEPSYWIFVQQNGGAFNVISAPQITPESAAIPGTPWPLIQGAEVIVTGGDCLNVREGPALNQAAVDCIPDGTTIKLATGPVDADGYQWWQVDGRAGWVVSEFLRYPDAQ